MKDQRSAQVDASANQRQHEHRRNCHGGLQPVAVKPGEPSGVLHTGSKLASGGRHEADPVNDNVLNEPGPEHRRQGGEQTGQALAIQGRR